MKCVICKHGQTRPGKATVPLTREQAVVVVKEVPAEICDNCGEFYVSEQNTKLLLQRAETALGSGVEVEIIRFAA